MDGGMAMPDCGIYDHVLTSIVGFLRFQFLEN